MRNGVCGLQFDRPNIKMNKFVACCLESQMHVFDARTQHPQKVRTAHPRIAAACIHPPAQLAACSLPAVHC